MKNVTKRTGKAKRSARVRLMTGSADTFFARSGQRAARLDRGQKLTSQMTVVFEDPSDLMRVLSAERIRVLRTVRLGPVSVSTLARDLNRDRQAVKRDVNLLESLGLLKTYDEPNPGHGRQKIVESVAGRYQLTATI